MKIERRVSLLPYNTFRIAAQAAVYVEYRSVDELKQLIQRNAQGTIDADGEVLPIRAIGEGSNLLFTQDYRGILLRSMMQEVQVVSEDSESVIVEAQAGMVLDELIEQLADMGLYGMENLSYIPGTVGASAVQNVGAYGVEAKDVIEAVKAIDIQTIEEQVFSNEQCRFGYRDSIFKNELKGRYVITAVQYRVSKKYHPQLEYGGLKEALAGRFVSSGTIRREVIRIRQTKLPDVKEIGSAGSFFKNPIIPTEQYEALQAQYPTMPHYETEGGVKIPAAWLIDQCGLKGKQIGDAQVYEQQPLVIINCGHASAQDVMQLAEHVISCVEQKFGITIHPEVEYI